MSRYSFVTVNLGPRTCARLTSRSVALLLVLSAAFIALALAPARADAAFSISAWKLTPSTTQAAGHPNVNFYLDPDAVAGDATGDDLKTVKLDFSAGMLANPEAVTPANRCTSTKFASDTCPSASQIGKITVNYRRNGSYYSMSGTMYELVTDPSSVLSFGFIVRPTGYKKIYLKSSKVAGLATVRTGIDADYGVTAVIDSIPRTITTTGGSVQNVTISKVSVDLQNRTNSSKSGPYFTFNPTRCTVASTRATMTSYLGVSTQKTSSFTPTGCSSVPFTPGFSATPSSTVAGAPIGLSATVTVPTASATIQQSHVKSVQTTLPTGTTLNFPNINAVSALCTDAQLSSDSCPAGSQIGTTSVSVPFLPPTMTGGIYLMGRSSSITFGYTLHGSGGTLVVLKGSATAVDLGSDGIPDAVRAYLIDLPQAPFSSATLNFTSQLINNPEGPCTSPSTVSAAINGWSGASATKTSSYTLTGCTTAPDTVIDSGPTSPTADNTPTFTFSSTVAASTFECSIDGSAFTACTSPYTTAALADGSHTFQVRAVSSGGTDATPASQSFVVDTTPPAVTITSPANGSSTGSTVTLNFTVTDATATATTCRLDAGTPTTCASGQVYSGLAVGSHTFTVMATDAAGNTGSSAVTFTNGGPPVVVITSPANNSTVPSSTVNVTFTVSVTPASITCKLDAAAAVACTSPMTYSPVAIGSHTVTVTATTAAGSGSATVTFNVGIIEPPALNCSVSGTTLTCSFTAGGGPVSYSCRLDGGAATACTSPITYSGLSQGAHTFTLCAVYADGYTGCVNYSFTVDTVAPVVSISSPANGSIGSSSVNAVFTVTDASATTTTCKLDAATAVACVSPKAYSGLSAGSHTIAVCATDQASNSGCASTTFTVSSAALSISVICNISGNSASCYSTISGGTPPYSTTCRLDNGAYAACTSPVTYSGLSAGTHVVTICATDAVGSSACGTFSFTISGTTPIVTITGGPANGGYTNDNTPTFTFSSNQPVWYSPPCPVGQTCIALVYDVTPYSCRVDSGSWVNCSSTLNGGSYTTTPLTDGSHTFCVTTTNSAGATSAPACRTFTVDTSPPVVNITSPVDGSSTTADSVALVYTATDASGAQPSCSPPNNTLVPLSIGINTIVVTCNDAVGYSASAMVSVTRVGTTTDTQPPVISGLGCTPGSSSVTCSWSATDASPPITFTCKLDAAAAETCTSPKTYTGVPTGAHTFMLTATDSVGNTTSASVTFTIGTVPDTTIIVKPGPATADTTPSFSFTATNATGFSCQIDAGPATACNSGSFTAPELSDVTIHRFAVSANNGAGSDPTPATTFFQVDTRAFGVSATVTKEPNSLTSAADVSAPAAHPDISSTVTLQGATDTKSAVIQLPHGLNGSLASIPAGSRCTIAQADAGACPASSIIGTGSGQVIVTDSATPLTVTGTGYMTEAPTSADAAGIAMKATLPGGRGDIIARGGVQLINNGTTIQATADNLPTTTTNGVAFHATSFGVTINGDTGGAAHPLVTNPSYCGAPSTAATGTGLYVPYRPSGDPNGANLAGYKGQFVNIVGNVTSYAATTATTSVPYTVTGCSDAAAPYAPMMSQSFTNPTAGATTAVTAVVSSPPDSSTTQRIIVKEPPAVGANFGSFGASSDQCPASSAINTGAAGVGNAAFNKSSCPPQARVGQIKIVTPLLESPVIGDVYLINKSPLPWLGIHIDPTITYPGRPAAEVNPQGVTLDLLATSATPTVHPTCSSENGDPNCGIGQPNCDLDTQFCQTQISMTLPMIPDMPVSSATLNLGHLADGVTAPPGRLGVGSIVSNDPMALISPGDNTCSTGIDPNTAGADTGGGAPFTQNLAATFTAWSRTNSTGSLLSGTSQYNLSQSVDAAGCLVGTPSDPVVIFSPLQNQVFPSNTMSVSFTTNGSPVSVNCALDGAAATPCTSPKTYTGLGDGNHSVAVTATYADSSSASDTVDFVVDTVAPNVTITSPANGGNVTSPASVSFSASDATTSVVNTRCSLDGLAATTCSSPKVYSGLSEGSHTVTVSATDQAGHVGSQTVSFNVALTPAVTIISPPASQVFGSNTVSVYFAVTNSPTSVVCSLDGGTATACGSPKTYTGLSDGEHYVVVTASNTAGSGMAAVVFTVDTTPPIVAISLPADGQTLAANVVMVTFSATDATTSVTGTTCAVDGAPPVPCSSPYTTASLINAVHSVTVTATDAAGNTASDSVTFTVDAPVDPGTLPPNTTITAKPGPATSSTTPSFSYTGTNSPTGFSCQIDDTTPVACNSGSFAAPALSDVTIHKFSVAASNAAGPDLTPAETYFLVDSRAYGVSATVTKEPNSLTSAADVNKPAQHPNVSSTVTLQGAADTKSAVLTLPHGLNGSLAAIPAADRCTIAQADAGNCPDSSIVGTGTGQIVVTDSATPLTVTGTGYMTEAPTAADAAGVAVKAVVPGGRGAIIARGGVQLINNGTTIQATADNLPTTTTDDPGTPAIEDGVPFHATSISMTIQGDKGGSAHPLVTNPSYCGTPSTATTGTGVFIPFRPTGDLNGSNLTGYKGQFNNIVGSVTSYAATTATTSVPYTVTGCSDAVAPYAPTSSQTLLNPSAGGTTAVTATVSSPTDNSTTQRIFVKEPPKLGANFGSFGASTDQCPSGSVLATGAAGIGNAAFNKSSCPPQARIGQIKIVTPLLDTAVIGDVYLVNKSPLPWLGIHVDPTITYPGRPAGEVNPQGVTLDLLATTATPTVHLTCSSANGDPSCGIGQSFCDLDTQFCQTQIQVSIALMPDVPVTSATIYLGRLADGTTPPPGRLGTGSIVSNEPMAVISSGDNTCATGIDPNTPGADIGGGTAFSPNAVSSFTAWSRTGNTGGLLAGTSLHNVSQDIVTPGC